MLKENYKDFFFRYIRGEYNKNRRKKYASFVRLNFGILMEIFTEYCQSWNWRRKLGEEKKHKQKNKNTSKVNKRIVLCIDWSIQEFISVLAWD